MEKRIDQIKEQSPTLPLVYYLRYISALHYRDVEAAFHFLRLYFDLTLWSSSPSFQSTSSEKVPIGSSLSSSPFSNNPRDALLKERGKRNSLPFILLNEALTHLHFEQWDEGLLALHEAIQKAQERGDNVTLAIALNSMSRFSSLIPVSHLRLRLKSSLAQQLRIPIQHLPIHQQLMHIRSLQSQQLKALGSSEASASLSSIMAASLLPSSASSSSAPASPQIPLEIQNQLAYWAAGSSFNKAQVQLLNSLHIHRSSAVSQQLRSTQQQSLQYHQQQQQQQQQSFWAISSLLQQDGWVSAAQPSLAMLHAALPLSLAGLFSSTKTLASNETSLTITDLNNSATASVGLGLQLLRQGEVREATEMMATVSSLLVPFSSATGDPSGVQRLSSLVLHSQLIARGEFEKASYSRLHLPRVREAMVLHTLCLECRNNSGKALLAVQHLLSESPSDFAVSLGFPDGDYSSDQVRPFATTEAVAVHSNLLLQLGQPQDAVVEALRGLTLATLFDLHILRLRLLLTLCEASIQLALPFSLAMAKIGTNLTPTPSSAPSNPSSPLFLLQIERLLQQNLPLLLQQREGGLNSRCHLLLARISAARGELEKANNHLSMIFNRIQTPNSLAKVEMFAASEPFFKLSNHWTLALHLKCLIAHRLGNIEERNTLAEQLLRELSPRIN